MLGEIETHAAPRDGHEPGKARFELMLQFLLESEVPVPRNRPTRVLNIEAGDYLFVHAPRLARGRRHRETRLGERLVAGRGAPSVPALTPPPVRETRARATRARPYRFLPLALNEKRPPTGFNTLQTGLLPQSHNPR